MAKLGLQAQSPLSTMLPDCLKFHLERQSYVCRSSGGGMTLRADVELYINLKAEQKPPEE
jgi:hypothetical protein